MLIQVNDQFSVPWVEANLSSAKRFFESVISLSVRQAPSVSCFKRGVRDYLTARSD